MLKNDFDVCAIGHGRSVGARSSGGIDAPPTQAVTVRGATGQMERPRRRWKPLSSSFLPWPANAIAQDSLRRALTRVAELPFSSGCGLPPPTPYARCPPLSGHRLGIDRPAPRPLHEVQRTLKVRKPVRVVRTIAASVDELELPTLCHLSLDLALNQRLGPGQGCHASVDVPGFRGRHHSYFTPSFFAPSDFVRYRAKPEREPVLI